MSQFDWRALLPVDGVDSTSTLSDYLIMAVLNLRKREVSEHGRHLVQYFHLFLMYGNLGVTEVSQCALPRSAYSVDVPLHYK